MKNVSDARDALGSVPAVASVRRDRPSGRSALPDLGTPAEQRVAVLDLEVDVPRERQERTEHEGDRRGRGDTTARSRRATTIATTSASAATA